MSRVAKPVTYNGETHTIKEWEQITGLTRPHMSMLMAQGRPLVRSPDTNMKFKVKDYHFTNIADGAVHELVVAIVRQAIEDWHSLCRGAYETRDRNFVELEMFFTNELPRLINSEITAKMIWRKRQKERRKAGV